MRIYFEKVSLYGSKAGKCGCGKRRQRKVTITNTINPFNKNSEGAPKSREEVLADVKKELDAWYAEPIYCDNCEPKN